MKGVERIVGVDRSHSPSTLSDDRCLSIAGRICTSPIVGLGCEGRYFGCEDVTRSVRSKDYETQTTFNITHPSNVTSIDESARSGRRIAPKPSAACIHFGRAAKANGIAILQSMTLQEILDEIERQPAWKAHGVRAPHSRGIASLTRTINTQALQGKISQTLVCLHHLYEQGSR